MDLYPAGAARTRAGLVVLLVACLSSFYLVGLLLLPVGFLLLRPTHPRA